MIDLGNLLSGLLRAGTNLSATRSRQERELRSMGMRELSDLGIGASEIPYLLHEMEKGTGNVDASETTGGKHECIEQTSFKQVLVLQQ